ncbi:SMI1/KNR4 family protein [Actinoplanes regularis]|uniref:SMI1/KNR4 family protein n=1 Tax=Actinoplanes regularis TaxID=52697 RepID=UPI0024A31B26|nr:SMI1/KNR4 family protein [Actinoplanes regularis]GLW34694.1 hypothetical protein Areg01_76310 [Actinoplanes regularis]
MAEEDQENLAIEAVRERIEAGEYLDSMPGVPGEDFEGGGAFRYAPDGQLARVHARWEPGFRAAREAGRIPSLPPLEPATVDAIEACEAAIGRPLPRLLRRCYLELGDGGFGPANGLVPVAELAPSFLDQRWPAGFPDEARNLLTICHWGCGITSFIDLGDPAGSMWGMDPNPAPEEEIAASLFRQDMTLASWLLRWTESRLYPPWLFEDPNTGRWHGGTDADWEGPE